MTARQWTVRVVAPAQFLNVNSRLHAKAIAPAVRAWRDATHIHARAARLPALDRARIRADIYWPTRRRRDAHNYMTTIKAMIDGLVDHGLLPDDSDQHLLSVEICGVLPRHPQPRTAPGEVVLTICEVA
jgi:crossover junction endodeoxyribonuclease RusA